jgi:hypothetical protein
MMLSAIPVTGIISYLSIFDYLACWYQQVTGNARMNQITDDRTELKTFPRSRIS